jgi:hypothetical protein
MGDFSLFGNKNTSSDIREYLEGIKLDVDRPELRLVERKFVSKEDSSANRNTQVRSLAYFDSKNSIEYDLSEFYA